MGPRATLPPPYPPPSPFPTPPHMLWALTLAEPTELGAPCNQEFSLVGKMGRAWRAVPPWTTGFWKPFS